MNANELKQEGQTIKDLQNENQQLRLSLKNVLVEAKRFRKEAKEERERANMLEDRLYRQSMADDRIKRKIVDDDEVKRLQHLCKNINKYNIQKLLELFGECADPQDWCEEIAKISMIISDLITRAALEKDDEGYIYPPDYADAFYYLKMLYEAFLSMDKKYTPKSFDVQFLITTQYGESCI